MNKKVSAREIIVSNEQEIFSKWLKKLLSSLQPDTLEKLTEQEMTVQSENILRIFTDLFTDKIQEDADISEISEVKDVLRCIFGSHAKMEIPPSETACFLLSLREVISGFFQEAFGDDFQLFFAETIKINRLTDNLLLVLFKMFSETHISEFSAPIDRTAHTTAYGLELISKVLQQLDLIKQKTEKETMNVIFALQRIIQKSGEGSKEAEKVVAHFTGNADQKENFSESSYVAAVIQEYKSAMTKTASVFQSLEVFHKELSDNLKAVTGRVKQISRFVEDIKEIASESKILAINAAIQARKAGESGRKFSVVAGEMRNLADMSARSAVNIREIAADSTAAVTVLQDKIAVQIGQSLAEMEHAEKNLKAAFGQFRLFADNISDAIKMLTLRYQAISQDIEDATVSLQFQDVVSQEIDEIYFLMQDFNEKCQELYSVWKSYGQYRGGKQTGFIYIAELPAGFTPRPREAGEDVEFF